MKKVVLIAISALIVFLVMMYLSVSETKDEFRTCTIIGIEDVDNLDFKNYDSVTVAANTLYDASWFKEIMQGEQYRRAWSTPISVPIVFLDTLKGGLRIIEEGGGKQTQSLELVDNIGALYTLRSLSKDPEKLVPDVAKTLGLENIIIDGVSAQHPYAALVVSKLSDFAGVLHTEPQLIFVPKQKTLGELNDKYGNRLYFFEYESEGSVDWTGLNAVEKLIDTEDLLQLRMKSGNNIQIDYNALVKARLFDIVIGDWDRHAKQWGWAIRRGEENKIAIPIPTDRDNAFFNLEGILPTLIANEALLPKLQTFNKEIEYLPGLVTEFDEYFLKSVSVKIFEEQAMSIQNDLTDKHVERAFKVWPNDIDSLDGKAIRKKIKFRRDNLKRTAKDFYAILKRRPRREIVLKGCEDLKLTGNLAYCFACSVNDLNM